MTSAERKDIVGAYTPVGASDGCGTVVVNAAEISRLTALNAQLIEALEGWQPIDSAPNDTAIMLYASGYIIGHFNTAMGKWIGRGRDTPDTEKLNSPVFGPTHWRPLPPPPSQAPVDGRDT